MSHKFLAFTVILCFEKRHPKQSSFIRQKSNILPPQKIFGLVTPLPPEMAQGPMQLDRLHRLRLALVPTIHSRRQEGQGAYTRIF